MRSRIGTIYALCDPETYAVRYVGKTVHKPEARLRGHVSGAKSCNHRAATWIRSLPTEPALRILQADVPVEILGERERHWIAEMRMQGCDLVNSNDGGAGPIQHSEETRLRYSIDRTGDPRMVEAGRKGGLALKGKPKSEEHKDKIRQTMTGKKFGPRTEAARKRMSEAAKLRGFNHKPGCGCAFCQNHRPTGGEGVMPCLS